MVRSKTHCKFDHIYIMGIMFNSSLDIKIIKYLMHCTLKIAHIDFRLRSSFIYGDQRILVKKKSF